MELIDTFANRLQSALDRLNMKQVDLVEKTGLDKTLINKYLAGVMKAKQDKLTILANALNVNEVWLMGYDIPMSRNINLDKSYELDNPVIAIPVLGTVKAGYDYLAEENIVGTEKIDYVSDQDNYYALRITGDSMEPLFSDGDIAIVHRQDDFESGNTCIVLINGDEATVKKVIKTEDGIDLIAMNPYYPKKHFSNEEMKDIPVKVIGKVVEARKRNQFK